MNTQPSDTSPLSTLQQLYRDPHSYPTGVAFVDGQYVPVSQAKVSILDWGFLHSDATYDTAHVWKGRFFRLDLHLDRFFAGVERLRMHVPYDRETTAGILSNCVALSGLRDAYVEILCTRGTSPTFSRDPRHAVNRVMAFAVPFGSVANPEQLARGLHVHVSKVVRIPPSSVNPAIKNYHWLDLVQGLYDAYDNDAETAVLLDSRGNIAEGPGFNIFILKDGVLRTPQFGVLPGITRRCVIDLCAEIGIPTAIGDVPVRDFRAAEEVFITSTAGGIMPVTRVDGVPIANGAPGETTLRLKDLYWEKHEDPSWSTAVTYPSEAGLDGALTARPA